MTVVVAPGAQFEAATKQFASGTTVGVRIRDNQGADTLARTTSGVTEDVTVGSAAVFRKTFAALSDQGQYTIVWDDGTTIDIEDLVVSASQAAALTGNLYTTRATIKSALQASGYTGSDDDIDQAINAASRAIDEACGRWFYSADETRVYTAGNYGHIGSYYSTACTLDIDDLNAITSLKVDNDGDGAYETTWTNGTDFFLDPPNASLVGKPWERVVIRQQSGKRFPGWKNAVQIVGSFGWAAVPNEVAQYCQIFATQLLLRTEQAPFGVLMAGMEAGSSVRISRFDPDFDRLLGRLAKPAQLIV